MSKLDKRLVHLCDDPRLKAAVEKASHPKWLPKWSSQPEEGKHFNRELKRQFLNDISPIADEVYGEFGNDGLSILAQAICSQSIYGEYEQEVAEFLRERFPGYGHD